jgi:hypothetical protein
LTRENHGDQKSYEDFWFLFLAGVYTLIGVTFFLTFQAADSSIKTNDFKFYILGWIVFLPIGWGLSALAEKLKLKVLGGFPSFGFLLAFVNFILLLYLLTPSNWAGGSNLFRVTLFCLLQLGVGLAVKGFSRQGQKLSPFLQKSLMVLMGVIFACWVLFLTPDTFLFLKLASISNALAGLLFILLLKEALKSENLSDLTGQSEFHRELFFYFLALFLIVVLVVDPYYRVETYHDSFYLGPLADFRAGKAFLVNINAQYGLFVFYFLSLFFKVLPLGFKSFSLVLTALFVLQYFCFYFIVRQLFSSRLYSFLCLIVLLLVNYFATMGFIIQNPSVGPLRFGFAYLLMTLVVLRNQKPKLANRFYIAEAAVAAAALFWSFEVCVYTLPAYLGFVCYESIIDAKSLKFNWKLLIRRLSLTLGFGLLLMGFIYADIYRRAAEWPHWNYYFDYIFLYKNGFGMMPVPAFGAWWIIIGILFISMCVVVGSLTKWKDSFRPAHFNAMVFLTFYGIFQFFYFLGRAHPNNLFHISMPSILLGAYWLYWLGGRRENCLIPEFFKKSILVLSVAGLGFYLQFLVPDMVFKLSQSFAEFPSLPQKTWDAARNLPLAEDELVQTADGLMNRYSGNKKKIVYFFGNEGLDVSMYTGRVKVYPYNDIGQLCICSPAVDRVLAWHPVLSPGDYLYLSKNIDRAYFDLIDGRYSAAFLEHKLLDQINARYNLRFVENQKNISVIQIVSEKKTPL